MSPFCPQKGDIFVVAHLGRQMVIGLPSNSILVLLSIINHQNPAKMKALITVAFVCTTIMMSAQVSATWVGGTPGKETAWNEAKNWSNHAVPDAFTDVYVKDVSSTTFSYPVIKQGAFELNALFVEKSAKITIEDDAQLVVYGYTHGIDDEICKIKGPLLVYGEILLVEPEETVAAKKY
jgi:hypothetical protein